MKSIQKFLLFLVCMVSGSTFLPFIMDYSHLKRGDKEIFLLGDCHVKSAIDEKERATMVRYLSAAQHYDKPITFVFEENEQGVCNFCKSCSKEVAINWYKDRRMINTIGYLYKIFLSKFKHPNLKMVYADCRNLDAIEFYLQGVKDKKNLKFFDKYTYKNYNKDMQAVREAARDYLKTHETENSQTREEINKWILASYLGEWRNIQTPLFCFESLFVMTEINFYINVVCSLQNTDKVVLYAGARHTNCVKEKLVRAGFKEVEHAAYPWDYIKRQVKRDKDGVLPYFSENVHAFDNSLLTADMLKKIFGCSLQENEHADVLFDVSLRKRLSTRLKESLLSVGIFLATSTGILLAGSNLLNVDICKQMRMQTKDLFLFAGIYLTASIGVFLRSFQTSSNF